MLFLRYLQNILFEVSKKGSFCNEIVSWNAYALSLMIYFPHKLFKVFCFKEDTSLQLALYISIRSESWFLVNS